MGYVRGLKCRESGREYAVDPVYVCEFCFGPLEVVYDYKSIKKVLTREVIEKRKNNLWTYRELCKYLCETMRICGSSITNRLKSGTVTRCQLFPQLREDKARRG